MTSPVWARSSPPLLSRIRGIQLHHRTGGRREPFAVRREGQSLHPARVRLEEAVDLPRRRVEQRDLPVLAPPSPQVEAEVGVAEGHHLAVRCERHVPVRPRRVLEAGFLRASGERRAPALTKVARGGKMPCRAAPAGQYAGNGARKRAEDMTGGSLCDMVGYLRGLAGP